LGFSVRRQTLWRVTVQIFFNPLSHRVGIEAPEDLAWPHSGERLTNGPMSGAFIAMQRGEI
jgi:hypothetical protein